MSRMIDLVLIVMIALGAWHVGYQVVEWTHRVHSPFEHAATELGGPK